MLTLQQLWDIARRHDTKMAEALAVACLDKAQEMGVTLVGKREFPNRTHGRGERPIEYVEWERMIRGNSDTPMNHL